MEEVGKSGAYLIVAQKLVDRDGADGGGEERQSERAERRERAVVEGAHRAESWLVGWGRVGSGRECDARGRGGESTRLRC